MKIRVNSCNLLLKILLKNHELPLKKEKITSYRIQNILRQLTKNHNNIKKENITNFLWQNPSRHISHLEL